MKKFTKFEIYSFPVMTTENGLSYLRVNKDTWFCYHSDGKLSPTLHHALLEKLYTEFANV